MERLGTAEVEELSQYLKSERLKRGLSLHEVGCRARLSISLLRSLEDGRFLDIGATALVYTHLMAYARALGCSDHPSANHQAPQPESPLAVLPNPPPSQGRCLPAKRPWALRLAGLLVIGVIVLGICRHNGWLCGPEGDQSSKQLSRTTVSPESPEQSETPPGVPATVEPEDSVREPAVRTANQEFPSTARAGRVAEEDQEGVAPATFSEGATVAPKEDALGQAVSPQHRFEVEASQVSWLEVKYDGKKTEGFLLHPGERREWVVVQEIRILVGNTGGVQMKWDGVPVNLSGRPGQVQRFRLPHPGLIGGSP